MLVLKFFFFFEFFVINIGAKYKIVIKFCMLLSMFVVGVFVDLNINFNDMFSDLYVIVISISSNCF